MDVNNALTQGELTLLFDIARNGPDCAKFIARRHARPLKEVMESLASMEERGWLERVQGTFLMKKGLKRPKHMNHTYYRLSRKAELYLREQRRRHKGEL